MIRYEKQKNGEPVIGPPTPSPDAVRYAGSIKDADVFIKLPNLRQYGDYSCGATCVQMIMNWLVPFGMDYNLADYLDFLGTTPEAGTSPSSIVDFFSKHHVPHYEKDDGWTIQELIVKLNAGCPMIMAIQAWSGGSENCGGTEAKCQDDLDNGHWVICVGYRKKDTGYIFYFNDPACVGYCLMNEVELDYRWVDEDAYGKKYCHYGIAVEPSKAYDPCGVFHLDE